MNNIESVVLNGVEIQSNGIIRNEKGRLIGRLVGGADFQGAHIKGVSSMKKEITGWEKEECQVRWKYHGTFNVVCGALYPCSQHTSREDRKKWIDEIVASAVEARNKTWNRAIEDAAEKVDDLLCFVAEPDAEYRDELSRAHSKGEREALIEAIQEIKSLYHRGD